MLSEGLEQMDLKDRWLQDRPEISLRPIPL